MGLGLFGLERIASIELALGWMVSFYTDKSQDSLNVDFVERLSERTFSVLVFE
jgi:hypothetical protein